MDYIMTIAETMKAVGVEAELAKVRIFKKLKKVRFFEISIIVDVVYL